MFHLVDGLEVTFLAAQLRCQPLWWLGASGSGFCYCPCLSLFSTMSSHYRCCYLLSILLMLLSWSSLYCQPHRYNRRIESSLVSLCIFGIHLNSFQKYLVLLEKSRWVRPTGTSVNRQQKKYQVNNPKDKKCFTWWLDWKWPSLVMN